MHFAQKIKYMFCFFFWKKSSVFSVFFLRLFFYYYFLTASFISGKVLDHHFCYHRRRDHHIHILKLSDLKTLVIKAIVAFFCFWTATRFFGCIMIDASSSSALCHYSEYFTIYVRGAKWNLYYPYHINIFIATEKAAASRAFQSSSFKEVRFWEGIRFFWGRNSVCADLLFPIWIQA